MDLIELSDDAKHRHPWELSRSDSVIYEIKKIHKQGNLLDIGCGDLYFDRQLVQKFNKITQLWGIDIHAKNDSSEGICHWVNNYKKLNKQKFDTILLLDVLEHTENDTLFLKEDVKPFLKSKDSRIILTVPAHQILFSKHDIELKHHRRYNIKEIKKICKESGLSVTDYHYFYFSLLPIRLLMYNRDSKLSSWRYDEKHIFTKIVRTILNIDYKICKFLSPFSTGLSLFAVVAKTPKSKY